MVYAIADRWNGGSFVLSVLRASDGQRVWGDASIAAASFDDIPAVATDRVESPASYRVAGKWLRDRDRWFAFLDIAP